MWKFQLTIQLYNATSTTKTNKCTIFSKGTIRKEPKEPCVNNVLIDNTRTFTYLGFIVRSSNCSFTPSLDYLSAKANKALYSLRSKLSFTSLPTKALLKEFDACIQPILRYGSEFWIAYADRDWENEMNVKLSSYKQCLKRLLGVL